MISKKKFQKAHFFSRNRSERDETFHVRQLLTVLRNVFFFQDEKHQESGGSGEASESRDQSLVHQQNIAVKTLNLLIKFIYRQQFCNILFNVVFFFFAYTDIGHSF